MELSSVDRHLRPGLSLVEGTQIPRVPLEGPPKEGKLTGTSKEKVPENSVHRHGDLGSLKTVSPTGPWSKSPPRPSPRGPEDCFLLSARSGFAGETRTGLREDPPGHSPGACCPRRSLQPPFCGGGRVSPWSSHERSPGREGWKAASHCRASQGFRNPLMFDPRQTEKPPT